MASTTTDTAAQIVAKVGGPSNIVSLTHCATRLRFELKDAGKVDAAALDKIPGVMGTVPQSGDRYQVVIGGAVQSTYNQIMNLSEMSGVSKGLSDADVKAAARAKARGKFAWLDAFFEYLSDSFRPLLGVLLGASLIIAFAAVLDALGVVDFRAADKSASWVFVDAMWRAVFYFLPIMVAYNAAKKLNIDPWVGATVMGAVMTPEFISLSNTTRFPDTICTPSPIAGADPTCVAQIFGLPMQLNGYGGQVFVPLIMVAVLALVYKALKRIFPANIQMVFVPFFSMIVMIPVTAFLIGPLGIWIGTGLGTGLSWLNTSAPLVFAVIIPMLYPFLVPLGLHWPLNALMLANIQTLGYDFIQGPMGSWNFACFGATAGVLVLAIRNRNVEMREVATGALAAGLLGGISEPSLYGIHLRYKRIYPRMLVGCAVGGLTTGLLGGVTTNAFAFTSLLTIPVFEPMWRYGLAITLAFFTAMILVIVSDYRTPEQKAQDEADRAQADADLALEAARTATDVPAAAAAATGPTSVLGAPVAGQVIPLTEVADKVFASKALGEGVGIVPANGRVVAPVSGVLVTVPDSGHAFGIRTDDGVEVLVHVGIDTVRLEGKGFDVKVAKDQRVSAGDVLADVDLDAIRGAGYDATTVVVVINTLTLSSVTPRPAVAVSLGDPVIDLVI
ncbi:PTS system IIA component (Glc family) /PTS system IIB component (Glc family) /PTS system IIC component (Glc family) [Propionicimonas paludicola]|uniref:PTS system IIA component (Glc family) /PTS system IIB component (Glc family) /PTS system IIC component (Glc family) n=1 Tax=Propionicimonas paludicola TaxID=185243 RepID=A0A2A9CW54_9ACTN|nr:glucose PTS transporter subunit IIA [Propionicimonas paludicola]PFG18245.1 PTS system IIA component (Glc family) /PTS system IIB component (Glc family) /PTS system IIC component (Glc family) [Propionicimonas paludicola]